LRLVQIEAAEFLRNLALWAPTGWRWLLSRRARARCHLLPLGYALPSDVPVVCTAPGFLDNWFHYAARLKVWSYQAARMASGLRWPFFSISHSAL